MQCKKEFKSTFAQVGATERARMLAILKARADDQAAVLIKRSRVRDDFTEEMPNIVLLLNN